MVIVDRIVWIVGQLLVEFDGVAFKRNHGLRHAEVGYLRGRVPGGTRSQLIAFDKHDICPSFLSEVIERGAACDATADDNHPCLRFHGTLLKSVIDVRIEPVWAEGRQQVFRIFNKRTSDFGIFELTTSDALHRRTATI